MADDSLNGKRLGRYEILERIGAGGMATVFKARHSESGDVVALKVLMPVMAQDPTFGRRFKRETRLLKQLDHPHIVPVLDFGEEQGYAYLVLPLLEVGSLADRLMGGRVTLQEGARIFDQISAALQYAHDRGVVHRDVKPSNILLDPEGNALLTDFGMAQMQDASISLTGSALVGTPAYVSPEAIRGETVDGRADQYAMGVILYQLATSQLPYRAETPVAVLVKHINDPLPSPRAVTPHLPVLIEKVIRKATAKDPDMRFDTMQAFNQVFQAALKHILDPEQHPAPKIVIPAADALTQELEAPEVESRSRRRRLMYYALPLLLLAMLCPLAGQALLGATALKPTGTRVAQRSDPELTAMAGTISALTTELAQGVDTPLAPEQAVLAAMKTLDVTDGAGEFLPFTNTPSTDSSVPASATGFLNPTRTSQATPEGGGPPNPSTTPPATATHTPPPTHTLAPTATPSWTSVPSATPSPVTPTENVCNLFSIFGFSRSGQELDWSVRNRSSSSATVNSLSLNWPSSNQELKKIEFEGTEVWNQGDSSPPTNIPPGWVSGNRSISAGSSKTFRFFFDQDAAPSPYSLSLGLSNGCDVSS